MLERIQRQRTKGWRMPQGAIYVGRPSKYGNPWRIIVERHRGQLWHRVRHVTEDRSAGSFVISEYALQAATSMYFVDLRDGRLPYNFDDVRRELGGHDLACLGRTRHDAIPALARAAVLRIDECLQAARRCGLPPHRVHVVAGVLVRRRHDPAER